MTKLLPLILLAGATFAQAQTQAKTNRYNVLFIAVDDLRPELGCYGADYAQTPNMDQFARTGMLFEKHYVQVATCHSSLQSSFRKTAQPLGGDSLVPMLNGGSGKKSDVAISYWKDAISVRDRTHRLIFNKKSKASALYDLTVNPDNNTDVAAQLPEVVKRLEKAIPE